MESVVAVCKNVLMRLSKMDYEKLGGNSKERLIFPVKNQANGDNKVDRVSEQELRQLFIDEFKSTFQNLYYSIETPTVEKYSFSNEKNEIKVVDETNKGQSALVDMSVYENENKSYHRIFNIEFKHKFNKESISKDVLKLIHEKENGAFILLLENTNSGSLNNFSKTRLGLIDKLNESINLHSKNWEVDDASKYIELVVLSLENKNKGNPFILYRKIFKNNLKTFDKSMLEWNNEKLIRGTFQKVD